MTKPKLNYHQVELLYEVIRSKTLTEAAKALRISQPAVTKQIKALEHSFGLNLFKREGGKLYPTVEATLLFEQMERANASLRALNDLADGIRTGTLGRLTICAYPAVAERLLPAALAKFQLKFPNISVDISIENTEKMIYLLDSHQIDIGICSPLREMKTVSEYPLLNSTIVCAVSTKDPLATRRSVHASELIDAPIATVGALEVIPELQSLISSMGIGRLIHMKTSSSAFACRWVQQTGHRAIVDSLTAASIDACGLVFIPIKGIPPRRICILRPSLRPFSTFSEFFLSIISEEAKLLNLRP